MPRYSNRFSSDFHDWSDSGIGSRRGAVYAAPSSEEPQKSEPKSDPSDKDWEGWLSLCQEKGWLHLVMKDQGWLAFKRGTSSYLTLISLEGDGTKHEYLLNKEENPALYWHLECWMTEARYQENFNRAAYSLFEN